MAQFLMAKFLSQALEWKVRFPTAQFYAGLKYEPFIYQWARRTFPDYSRLYPDDREFTQKFVKDLRNKNEQLLKIINPQVTTPEQETTNVRFETEARLEQQQVAQTNPQEVTQPFSLASPPIPRIPSVPTVSPGSPPSEPAATMESPAEKAQEQSIPQPTQPASSTTKGVLGQIPQVPKIPSGMSSFAKGAGTNLGLAFQKYIGRYTTFGNAITGAFSAIGGLAGGVFTNGNPLGVIAGAGAGGIGSTWARSREGLQSMGNLMHGGINSMVRLSNEVSRGGLSLAGPKNKVLVWGLIGGFLLFFVINIAGGIISPQTTSSGAAAPVVGGPSYTGGGAGIVSCPLNNARISCGSKFSGHSYCNHCGSGYEPYTCPADAGTGRDTAIDVVSSDTLIFLPFISGSSVQWTIDETGTAIPISEEGGGIAVAATAKSGEKTYRIRFVHIASTNLKVNDQVQSGTLIGQYISTASHTHITIQENGEFKPADLYFNLCGK